LGVITATALITLFAAKTWLFPQPFTPVVLSPTEEQQLEKKLEHFESLTREPVSFSTSSSVQSAEKTEDEELSEALSPEAYNEEGASREINFSEREINSLLANNTDLARKLAIDLADDLISVKLLLPVDPDFPLFGGKTLRVRAGAELAYHDNKPIVKLRGVSVMGVPLPNSWLGGIKNIDLVREFGAGDGFWNSFADGIESINVREKNLYVKLKE